MVERCTSHEGSVKIGSVLASLLTAWCTYKLQRALKASLALMNEREEEKTLHLHMCCQQLKKHSPKNPAVLKILRCINSLSPY